MQHKKYYREYMDEISVWFQILDTKEAILTCAVDYVDQLFINNQHNSPSLALILNLFS